MVGELEFAACLCARLLDVIVLVLYVWIADISRPNEEETRMYGAIVVIIKRMAHIFRSVRSSLISLTLINDQSVELMIRVRTIYIS